MKRAISTILTLVLFCSVYVSCDFGQPVTVQAATAPLRVHFIEVGTGDAALVQYGSGASAKYALIDAGPKTSTMRNGKIRDVSRMTLNYLKRMKVKRLEFIVMSHPHVDHIGGMISLLEDTSIAVGKIYCTDNPVYSHYTGEDDLFSTGTYRKVKKLIVKRNIPTLTPAVGSYTKLGEASIRFYAPAKMRYSYGREVNFNDRQINKFSIVCRIKYGSNTFLMTGDTQQETEYEMMANSSLNLHAQVLKVPHHGYEDVRNKDIKPGGFSSNHKAFFDRVAPAVSVISNGYYNRDRIPSNLIVRELSKSNIYTTGTNGNIVISSNKKYLTISSSKNYSEPAYTTGYIASGKASRLVKKVTVKSNGKKKVPVVASYVKNTYKIKEKKKIKLKIQASAKSYASIKKVQYKLVKRGKNSSKYRWKTGKSVKVKRGFKGRLHIKIKTSAGSTTVKTKGFKISKK